jgi:hypothetical protein
MLTSIFVSLIAALPTFAPVLVTVALYLINLFVSNSNQKAANEQAFLSAVSDHLNDGLDSVAERQNAWQQRQELLAKTKAEDAAVAAAVAAAALAAQPKPSPPAPTPKV